MNAPALEPASPPAILPLVLQSLEDDKALEPVVIDLAGKTTMADQMVIATGTSQRHLASMAERLIQRLKAAGRDDIRSEGLGDTSWVLIDASEVIIHLFRAETRSFYDIERLWRIAPPERRAEPLAEEQPAPATPPLKAADGGEDG